MNFLKRHYDKVILLGLFVLFVGLMLYVLNIVEGTKAVSERDLNINIGDKAYSAVDEQNEIFNAGKHWQDTVFAWSKDKNGKDKSDLVDAAPLAFCPHCEEKNPNQKKLISFGAFGKTVLIDGKPKIVDGQVAETVGECPFCKGELKKPKDDEILNRSRRVTPDDLDGDGISNDTERRYGFNPNDEKDALYDNDGDGFSNLYEVMNNTDPTRIDSHPPLWHRLSVKSINTVRLPIELKSVNTNNTQDKKQWELQYNIPEIDRRGIRKVRSKFVFIGDENLELEERDRRIRRQRNQQYRLVDIIPLKNGVSGVEQTYKVILEPVVSPDTKVKPSEIIETVVGKPVYSSDKRPILVDTGILPQNQEIIRRIGTAVTLERPGENKRPGENNNPVVKPYSEIYRIDAVDIDSSKVTITDLKNNKSYVIVKDGMVPRDCRPVEGGMQNQSNDM